MKSLDSSSDKHTVPAVNNALDLIRVLAEEEGEATSKALAIRLGIPRSSCYRILKSLVSRDWVRVVNGGQHVLSLGLIPLLQPLQKAALLSEAVEPVLKSLANEAQMTAKVTVRQGDYAVTIARGESPQLTSVAVRLGAAFHLALGSSGAVFLYGVEKEEVTEMLARAPKDCWLYQKPEDVWKRLKEIQSKGWCADLGLNRQKIHAISVPLRDAKGNVMAAMTLIGFPHELSPERLAGTAKMLSEAARRAEKELRHLGPTSQPGKQAGTPVSRNAR